MAEDPVVIVDSLEDEVDEVESTPRDYLYIAQKTYVYEQAIASATWTIVHNLDKYPSVTVIDSSGDQVFANLSYIDSNELVLNFGAEFCGKAYLN